MPFRFAEDHSTLTGGNVLARREAETAEISDRASHLPANGTPVGLGAVFDNDQIVAPRDFGDSGHIDWATPEVNRDDGASFCAQAALRIL